MFVTFLRDKKELIAGFCHLEILVRPRKLTVCNFSEQQLVSPYTDVPNSVQILNLAGNDITNIDNDCFKVTFNNFLTILQKLNYNNFIVVRITKSLSIYPCNEMQSMIWNFTLSSILKS